MKFLIFLLLAAFVLEISFSTLPFVLLALLIMAIKSKNVYVFPVAFFSGILLDLVRFNTIGISSIFFVATVFLVLIYQRKFEINSAIFVFLASFFASLAFLFMKRYDFIFLQTIIASFLAVIIFEIFNKLNLKVEDLNYG